MAKYATLLTLLAAASTVAAHPGVSDEHIKREMALRNVAHAQASRSLSGCRDSPQARALHRRAAERRANKAVTLRQQRGLSARALGHQKRDMTELLGYVNVDHNRTAALGYSLETPEATIFGSNNTCALVPETTIGPYYVLGEYVRSNITDGQAGVPMHIDLQFVDVTTCQPVPQMAADVWHANSTGFYSGVSVENTLDEIFLRGAQISDEDGVVAFDSLFPGHYANRATHFHVVALANVTEEANGTFTGGVAQHIGQLYFDDALVQSVEATVPYTSNTAGYTTPMQDGWMLEEATTDYDPFVEYVQLTDDIADGLLAWITIAVNTTSDYTSKYEGNAVAHYYADGGVAISGAGRGTLPSNPCAVGSGTTTCSITPAGETIAL